MTWQIWPVYALIAAAMYAYARERVSLELTSVAVVIWLLLLFHFFPLPAPAAASTLTATALLSGFANPALITVMALLVIGHGVFLTDALAPVLRLMQRAGRRLPITTLLLLLALIAVTSAFLNNTPVVIMSIPLVGALALRCGMARSRVMMPVSFLAILGGMTTLIGSSTNILVAESARIVADYEIGFFDFLVPGAFLMTLGMAYLLLFAPRLLPNRDDAADAFAPELYTMQIRIVSGHPLMGASISAEGIEGFADIQIYALYRNGRAISHLGGTDLRYGDLLVAAATRDVFAALLREHPGLLPDVDMLEIRHRLHGGADGAQTGEGERHTMLLAEAVVTPASHILHRRPDTLDFARETGCLVLGARRPQEVLTRGFRNIELEAGDVLLLLGRETAVRDLRFNHDIFPLEGAVEALPDAWRGRWAAWILFATVLTAASGTLPLVVAALLGAGAMLAVGVLSLDEAVRALDRRIYLLIGASLAMSAALEATGGAQLLASTLVFLTAGLPEWVAFSFLFLIVALVTNMLSNNATAVLFTPVAIGMAAQLGMDPRMFLHAVIFAANACFLTPIAYQTNLLVMAPGNYRFADYAKLGAPLLLLLWIGYSFFAPFYYTPG